SSSQAPCTTLVPYTTLFRSDVGCRTTEENRGGHEAARVDADNGRRDRCPDPRILVVATQDSCEVVRRGEDGTGANFWAHAVEYRSEEHTSELQSRVDLVCRL